MNRTRNPVVTVSEHRKPLDHPGIYISLKLVYYIHCLVTPRQTSATPSPSVTDITLTITLTRQRITTTGRQSTTIDEDNAGAHFEPQVSFFFSFFLFYL